MLFFFFLFFFFFNDTATTEIYTLSLHDALPIWVADSGPGIAPEQLEAIFDRFARLDVGRSRDRGGVGLGLAIVKAIAEAHGGSIRVRSALGRGSVFEVLLPAPLAPLEAAAR